MCLSVDHKDRAGILGKIARVTRPQQRLANRRIGQWVLIHRVVEFNASFAVNDRHHSDVPSMIFDLS